MAASDQVTDALILIFYVQTKIHKILGCHNDWMSLDPIFNYLIVLMKNEKKASILLISFSHLFLNSSSCPFFRL